MLGHQSKLKDWDFNLFILKYINGVCLKTQKEMGLRSANPLSKIENEIEKRNRK